MYLRWNGWIWFLLSLIKISMSLRCLNNKFLKIRRLNRFKQIDTWQMTSQTFSTQPKHFNFTIDLGIPKSNKISSKQLNQPSHIEPLSFPLNSIPLQHHVNVKILSTMKALSQLLRFFCFVKQIYSWHCSISERRRREDPCSNFTISFSLTSYLWLKKVA